MIAWPKMEIPELITTSAKVPIKNQGFWFDLAIMASPVKDNPNPINNKPAMAYTSHLRFNFLVSFILKSG